MTYIAEQVGAASVAQVDAFYDEVFVCATEQTSFFPYEGTIGLEVTSIGNLFFMVSDPQQGDVDAIRGTWDMPPEDSVNYRTYTANLRRIAPDRLPLDEEKAEAALGTWTCRQVTRLSYTIVKSVEEKSTSIRPFFSRPH